MIPKPKNSEAKIALELWLMSHVKCRLWAMRGNSVKYAHLAATHCAEAFDTIQAYAQG